MSVPAKLIERYNNELMADANVRNLVRAVAQDPQNETVDYAKSNETVRKVEFRDGGAARRKVIGWLNAVFFSKSELPVEWWFEMCTRLKKLLIVSMILEGDNLRSFGATPATSDIPQCLVGIWLILIKYTTYFDEMRADYAKKVSMITTTKEGEDFIRLYCREQ